jgi:hypothetical protein
MFVHLVEVDQQGSRKMAHVLKISGAMHKSLFTFFFHQKGQALGAADQGPSRVNAAEMAMQKRAPLFVNRFPNWIVWAFLVEIRERIGIEIQGDVDGFYRKNAYRLAAMVATRAAGNGFSGRHRDVSANGVDLCNELAIGVQGRLKALNRLIHPACSLWKVAHN